MPRNTQIHPCRLRDWRAEMWADSSGKARVVWLFLILTSLSAFSLITIPQDVRAATLEVGGFGPGNFTSIQSAINAASPGDTIFVHEGAYHEKVIVSKTLILQGERKENTIVVGFGTGDVIQVTASNVQVSGFTVMNGTVGIELDYVVNCLIEENIAHSNEYGMSIYKSDSNTIRRMEIHSNSYYGIMLFRSEYNLVMENTVTSNGGVGIIASNSQFDTISDNKASDNAFSDIHLDASTNTIVTNNEITDGGIHIGPYIVPSQDLLEHWNTHTIDSSNTVNGKPVYYYKNMTGGTIPADAGQVIVVNCENLTVQNQNISNGFVGITVSFSTNTRVVNNTASSSALQGIYVIHSDGTAIVNNTVASSGKEGILLVDSSGSSLSENLVTSNSLNGITLMQTENDNISSNSVHSNGLSGIEFMRSSSSALKWNSIRTDGLAGIRIRESVGIAAEGNLMTGGGIQIVGRELGYWNTHTITEDNMIDGRPVQYWKNSSGGTVPPDAGQIILANCVDVMIKDQDISNATLGIQISYSDHNTLSNTTVRSNMLVGTYLHFSDANTISGGHFAGNGLGFYIYRSRGNVVTDNNISYNVEGGIHLQFGHGNIIAENTIATNKGTGVLVQSSDLNVIEDNRISDSEIAISLSLSLNSYVWRNSMERNGIFIYAGSLEHWNTHMIEASNTVNGRPVRYLKNMLSGTIPSGAGQVILANSTGIVVDGQNLSNSSVGILSAFSSDNTFSNNTLSSNSMYGAYLIASHSNVVSNNTILNSRNGLRLAGSDRNVLEDNRISSNELIGINLSYAEMNVIKANIISNNDQGIAFKSSQSNFVFHNSLIGNTQQACDDRSGNYWDIGYPLGGNYWDDYAGVDFFSGPDQNQPGSDGIGDTPYHIDIFRKDAYPLMYPVVADPPRPPDELSAELSGMDFENVTLTWALSPDDGGGSTTVIGYRVYRSASYDPTGLVYELIASVANGTSTLTDVAVGNGHPNNYFYRVCAFDALNSTTCSLGQAAKFTLPLAQGPKLISIPLMQSNDGIQHVLRTVKYDKAWSYDSSSQEWDWYMKDKTYSGGLSDLNHTLGIWLNVTDDCNFTVAGIVPARTTIRLYEGWNLVSFPSFNTSYTVADLKAETGATSVEGYHLAPPHYLRVLGDAEVFQTGYGYWVKVEADVEWTVPFG